MTPAEYQKDRRATLRAVGICSKCGSRDAVRGMVKCEPCRDGETALRFAVRPPVTGRGYISRRGWKTRKRNAKNL